MTMNLESNSISELSVSLRQLIGDKLSREKLNGIINILHQMKAQGVTETNNPECASALNYLRSLQLDLNNRSNTKTPRTEEQIRRLKCQKYAFALLANDLPVPSHVFIGMMSSAQVENFLATQALEPSLRFPIKILVDDSQESICIPYIPTPEQVSGLQKSVFDHEQEIRNRVNKRIEDLEMLPSNLANDPFKIGHDDDVNNTTVGPKLKALIELKSLKLWEKQQKLRQEILQYSNYRKPEPIRSMTAYRRKVAVPVRDWPTTEKAERERVQARLRRVRDSRLEYINAIYLHGQEIRYAHDMKYEKRIKMGRTVLNFHSNIQKQAQKEKERVSKERINALKNNDEEAYLKLIDEEKDTRITHLLRQTDTYLESLTQAVIDQQNHHRRLNKGKGKLVDSTDHTVTASSITATEDEDNIIETMDGKKIDYYAVAHRVQEKVEQPSILIGGLLKDYQIKGLQWMVSLYNNHLNGILADEMGLGKTIQTISLITYLIEKKKQNGPFLIIVPLSTMTNWQMEFEKWAPMVSERLCIYKGTPTERKALQRKYLRCLDFYVFLTTYEYIIKDKTVLSKPRWLYCIIDEGHRMKNVNSRLSLVLSKEYNFRYRLILTGTPLQNNLPELWSLLNFVLPKIFNSVSSFEEWFNTPFANAGGQDKIALNEEESLLVIRRLHKVLRPFLLRRLKKDVESELPDKVERVIKVKLSALQIKLYHQMQKHGALFVNKGEKGKTGIKGLNNTIIQLRKICCHPFVFKEVETDINTTNDETMLIRVSGKFEFLDRILPKLLQSKHRVLIFFQMTAIMDIMEDYLHWRQYKFLRLDGNIKAEERTRLLKDFNAPDSPYFIFLLSTRAGGLGLNLQSADTVIIFDSDWNPHQDLQAQDRAHRIGQTNEVRILRLISQNSIEETVLARAQYKLDIDGKVIQAGKFDQKSTPQEREAYLRSLVEGSNVEGNDVDEHEELDDDEINVILARNDDELSLFKQIDIQRIRGEEVEWRKKGNVGPVPNRLIQENELPDVYLREYETLPDTGVEYGRGQRQRKEVIYDDGLTEDQFLNAVENNEDLEGLIAKKQLRRQARKKRRDATNTEESSPHPNELDEMLDSIPTASASGVMKRITLKRTVGDLEADETEETQDADASVDTNATPRVSRRKSRKLSYSIKEQSFPGQKRIRKPDMIVDSEEAAATVVEALTELSVIPNQKKKGRRRKFDSVEGDNESSSSIKRKNKGRKIDRIEVGIEPSTLAKKKGKGRKIDEIIDEDTQDVLKLKHKKPSKEETPLKAIFTECLDYIENLTEEEDGVIRKRAALFIELPSRKKYPYYYQQIEHPIAINLIRQKISRDEYSSAEQFKNDVYLMFDNARTFNIEGSQVYSDAEMMQAGFDAKFTALCGN
ncbi:ATP-dependent helicase STH1/SNF2 [Gigaspora margarita]|uniref:ATP-dependent helicase STH1/SNF2 n=1 Tax=Gigaspora margarita TaxID=4874 RepID=A0A8H4AS08_GIGMA|nr:ATP-dependent helicase STH1/SNF2 [Gigaspora margarita]